VKTRKLKVVDFLTSNKGYVVVNSLTEEQIKDFEKYKNKTSIQIDIKGQK